MEVILRAESLCKGFDQPDSRRLEILKNVNLDVETGSIVCITGVSGSGKSTLLHLLGSLDRPDEGDIFFDGESILSGGKKKISRYRNQMIGFVFQFHYLMPELTVLENVASPLLLNRFRPQEAREESLRALSQVGLEDKAGSFPHQLSGGEKQRVAIARSLINHPRLLLADEPTGNLDWHTGEQVFGLFQDLIRSSRLTAVIVSHNPKIAEMSDKAYLLQEGTLRLLS